MEVKQSYKGPTIYTGNQVDEDLVDAVKNALEVHDSIHVCFDVIGRTKHVCLSNQLVQDLGEGYEAGIDYLHYNCEVRRSAKWNTTI